MKRNLLIVLLLLCLGIAGYTFYTSWRLRDPEFQRQRTMGASLMLETPEGSRKAVDLDDYAQLRPAKAGTREIGPIEAISFEAIVKEAPKSIETGYLKEAMGILRVSPMPKVTHRMFVQSAKGMVMPVYVWDDAAPVFAAGEEMMTLRGYKVYLYAKGPAIVVDGFEAEPWWKRVI